MFDHLGIGVSNLKAGKAFFLEATTGCSFGVGNETPPLQGGGS
jgi:hypothetical protein